VLRLVVVQGGRHPWYLVTSVLDRRRLRDSDVATIYRKRWGIEVSQSQCPSSAGLYQLAA
jgi:hypothetical protein